MKARRRPTTASRHVAGAVATAVASSGQLSVTRPSLVHDYWTLTKPEISLLVVLSAVAGYVLGEPGLPDFGVLAALTVGVALTSAGVGSLNQYFERELDARMRRTSQRPIPAGRVSPSSAASFGTLLVIAGVGLLCPLTNPLTGILAASTVLLYLFVYTPLKRVTTLNTLIGTVPGALPALGGWTAATNNLAAGGWLLFAILAVWQMPHFLSLAWLYRKDYARAGMVMPAAEGSDPSAALQMLLFAAILVPLGALPWIQGLAGAMFGVGATLLGAGFVCSTIQFLRAPSPVTARRVLLASIAYIPLLLAILILDRLL